MEFKNYIPLNIQRFSGTLSVSGSDGNISIENNTSYISGTITITTGSSTYNNEGTAYYQINGGAKNYFKIGKGKTLNFNYTLGPYTHNADGSLGAQSVSVYVYITSSTKLSQTINVGMQTIPRASNLSISGNTLNSPVTVNISRYSNNFTHTLIYNIGNVSRTFTNLTTSCTFTPQISDASQFPSNSSSANATFTLITYSGGTEIGRKAVTQTMYLGNETDYNPTFTYTLSDSENLHYGSYIQNVSYLNGVINASGRYGATIKSYSITFDNSTYSSSSFVTNSPISQSGQVSGTIVVTDTRNKSTTQNFTISVAPYTKPTINSFSVVRDELDETNAIVSVDISSTDLNGENSNIYQLKYKSSNQIAYTTIQLDNTHYSLIDDINVLISGDYSYEFILSISDDFYTIERSIDISSAFALINWNSSGKGIAFGKVSERDAFEINMDLYYKGQTLQEYIEDIIDEYNNT